MQSLLETLLSNTAIAALLSVVAMVAGRYRRRPALVYILWVLVLVKLVTPPLVSVRVAYFNHGARLERAVEQIPEPSRVGDRRSYGSAENIKLPSGQSPLLDNSATADPIISSDAGPQSLPPSLTRADLTGAPAAAAQLRGAGVSSPNDRMTAGALAVKPSATASFPWTVLLLGIWLAGSLTAFTTMLVRIARFCRQVRHPWPTDANLQQQADKLAKRFGLARAPEVKLVNASLPPMLWGMQRSPVIFLPRVLVERFHAEQTETLLAHELAHYRRRDHWVRWFEVLIVGFYWWHPLAWLARRQLRRAEEECCDAWVLWALPAAAAVYARTILETVDFLTADYHPSPALASGLGPVHVLERRFEMILHTPPSHRVGSFAKTALLALALVVLPLSAGGQVVGEPGKPEAAPTAETPKVPAATRLPDNSQQATEPTAVADPAAPVGVFQAAAEPTAPVAAGGPAAPIAVGGSTSSGSTQPIATTAPAIADAPQPVVVGAGAPAAAGPTALPASAPSAEATRPEDPRFRRGNSTEDRLARLEQMMQMMLAERNGQLPRNHAPTAKLFRSGSADAMGNGSAAVSLSELKKQRIDLEDELESIKDRMDKIDAQIAKLQSARSSKLPANDALRSN